MSSRDTFFPQVLRTTKPSLRSNDAHRGKRFVGQPTGSTPTRSTGLARISSTTKLLYVGSPDLTFETRKGPQDSCGPLLAMSTRLDIGRLLHVCLQRDRKS